MYGCTTNGKKTTEKFRQRSVFNKIVFTFKANLLLISFENRIFLQCCLFCESFFFFFFGYGERRETMHFSLFLRSIVTLESFNVMVGRSGRKKTFLRLQQLKIWIKSKFKLSKSNWISCIIFQSQPTSPIFSQQNSLIGKSTVFPRNKNFIVFAILSFHYYKGKPNNFPFSP